MSHEDMWCLLQDFHDDSDKEFHTMLENFPIPISLFDDCDACDVISGERIPKRRKTQRDVNTEKENEEDEEEDKEEKDGTTKLPQQSSTNNSSSDDDDE